MVTSVWYNVCTYVPGICYAPGVVQTALRERAATWQQNQPPCISMTPYLMQNLVDKWVDFQNFPKFEPIARKFEKQFFMTVTECFVPQ